MGKYISSISKRINQQIKVARVTLEQLEFPNALFQYTLSNNLSLDMYISYIYMEIYQDYSACSSLLVTSDSVKGEERGIWKSAPEMPEMKPGRNLKL